MTAIIDLYRQLFGRKGTNRGSDIDMAEHGRLGGISTNQPFKFVDQPNYAIKITVDGTDTYVAYAPPGTAEATDGWKAMRLDTSDGLKITYAGGTVKFNNVATDLTALTYS